MWRMWDRTRSGPCGYHIVRKGKFLTSGGMGTMGYSIPAAMGAKLGDPSKQVIAVCGDGSFQMSMMELATMRQHHVLGKNRCSEKQLSGHGTGIPALYLSGSLLSGGSFRQPGFGKAGGGV